MEHWFCLEQIIRGVTLSQEIDSLIWQYEIKGKYTSSTMYNVVNFRGITPVYIPAVWKIIVPPRVNIFLWLFANNKLMSKDNLLKRGIEKSPECMFCTESESIQHLFFDCVVAKLIWEQIASFFNRNWN